MEEKNVKILHCSGDAKKTIERIDSAKLLNLDNKNCSERLGDKIVFEIKEMLKKRYKDIIEINKYNSLIHGDFKLSNLMIDKYNKVYITDFEFCNYGSTVCGCF